MQATRDLAWDGCLNVRDLGGLPTEDGGETRFGAVVRSDSVRRLTDAGWRSLAEHGVRTVLDLRTHGELAEDAPREVGIDVVHVSVMPEADDPFWPEMQALARAEGPSTARMYLETVRRFGDRYAHAVGVVAQAPPGGVVVHCHSGKDRTGLVVAFLLRLAGVSVDHVADDYALSSARLESLSREWIEEAEDEEERARRTRMAQSPAPVMREVLGTVEAEHGSVAALLRANGLGDELAARARGRLRA